MWSAYPRSQPQHHTTVARSSAHRFFDAELCRDICICNKTFIALLHIAVCSISPFPTVSLDTKLPGLPLCKDWPLEDLGQTAEHANGGRGQLNRAASHVCAGLRLFSPPGRQNKCGHLQRGGVAQWRPHLPLYSDPPSAYSITRQTWEGGEKVIRNSGRRIQTYKITLGDAPSLAGRTVNAAAWLREPRNLRDYCKSRTTSQCWGGSRGRAAGAGDKEGNVTRNPICMRAI